MKHEYEEYNCSSSELQSNLIIENERRDLNSKGNQDDNELNKKNYNYSKPKKNYDSTVNFKKNNINHIFDEEKFVDNDSVIINHSEENIPFALEKRFEICSNEYFDSYVENYSSSLFHDVAEEPITNNCNDNLNNMFDGILLNSIDLEDVTNERLSFTIIDEINKKIIKNNYVEKKQKILYDSDLVAIDNWRNKGRPSHYDYCNSLNCTKENEESPVKIFEKKVLAPKQSLTQKNYHSSIIHVLAIAGKDDRQFLIYMKENLNPTLKLICDYIEKGPITSIYLKRTVILSQLFKDRLVKKKN